MTALWTAISTVWTAISTWFVSALTSIQELFWNSSTSSLTFVGTLSIIGLGIGVIFLLIGVISNFLHLRT